VLRSPEPAELAEGERFAVQGQLRLGRDTDNDVVLPDLYATQHHATITYAHGACRLQDRCSTNGTRVNGDVVDGEVELADGDTLELANTEFRYYA
jgi:pSer/pThr/pTyr-binding forkhead associated (FHA) protein